MSDLSEQQIDTFAAGLTLDLLVAESLQMQVKWDNKERAELSFRPSSDWNDAMLAAEMAELFLLTTVPADPKVPGRHSTAQFQAFLTRDCGYWTVNIYRYFAGYATGIMNRALEHESVSILAEDKSGPVAVCKAILKMKMAG